MSCRPASTAVRLGIDLAAYRHWPDDMRSDGPQEKDMPTLESLEKRRRELEAEIAEAQKRLPAHSVKPLVMAMLLDLEDEYERVMQQIAAVKKNGQT